LAFLLLLRAEFDFALLNGNLDRDGGATAARFPNFKRAVVLLDAFTHA
jgi:hypothetical protein